MTFVQTIDLEAVDRAALADHLAAWHSDQHGVAPGYEGYRLLADRDRADHFTIVVEFSSADEAEANNGRPETAAWAAKLSELAATAPSFTSFDVVPAPGS